MVKKSSLMFLFSFVFGILIVNLIGQDFLASYGMLSFWSPYLFHDFSLSYDKFFLSVLWERIKQMFVLLLLGHVIEREIAAGVCGCIVSLFFGIFVTMAVIDRGLTGMAIAISAILPQWIFYAGALYLYEKRSTASARIRGLLLLLLLLLGSISEGYISPFFLKNVI